MKILNETQFIKTLGAMAGKLLKEILDSEKPRPRQFKRPLNNKEEYLRTCLVQSGEISIACDQLYYALAFFSGYKSRKTSEGELITRADYIAFQLENLYLRFLMIPDRSFRLTNEVFRLGLPDRECGARTITKNKNLSGTEVRKRLNAIEKIVQPYRETRNTIAHFARYNDSQLSDIEVYSILQKSEEPPDDSVLEITRNIYKHKADEYIEDKRNEFNPVVNNLICEVAGLYEALLPHFMGNYEFLK